MVVRKIIILVAEFSALLVGVFLLLLLYPGLPSAPNRDENPPQSNIVRPQSIRSNERLNHPEILFKGEFVIGEVHARTLAVVGEAYIT